MSEFYSQYSEDRIISRLLRGMTGKLLDVGAWVPRTFSNSRLLIEQGWEAVLIEFSPGPVRDLVAEYGNNPKVRVIQAALTLEGNGNYCKFDVSDDGLSTADPVSRSKWAESGGYFGSLWVAQLTWEHLFFQFGGGFDFISIDTEGTSVDLAKQLLVMGQEPKALCVEHDGRSIELMSVAQEKGYAQVWGNGTNVILARI